MVGRSLWQAEGRREEGSYLPGSRDRQVPPACDREVIGPYLPGGPVLAPPSPTQLLDQNHLLPLEQMPGLPTDLSHRTGQREPPDRCQVQRGSQASGDGRELHTKGPRVTGEKQSQMGPASPCQQGSLRSARPGLSALMPLARPTLGPDPSLLQMLSPLPWIYCVCFIPPCPESLAITAELVILWLLLRLSGAQHSTVCKAVFTLIALG